MIAILSHKKPLHLNPGSSRKSKCKLISPTCFTFFDKKKEKKKADLPLTLLVSGQYHISSLKSWFHLTRSNTDGAFSGLDITKAICTSLPLLIPQLLKAIIGVPKLEHL